MVVYKSRGARMNIVCFNDLLTLAFLLSFPRGGKILKPHSSVCNDLKSPSAVDPLSTKILKA